MLEPWIETFSGKKMYFLDPTSDMVDINDIAHSLAHQCRFSGHTRKFYSVAEHSINVCREVEKVSATNEAKLQALLHDASEAYLLDVPSPVKQYLTNYKEIETRIQEVIFRKFNLPYPFHKIVNEADQALLKREAHELLPSKGESWLHLYPTMYNSEAIIEGMPSWEAKSIFIMWFNYLRQEIKNDENRATKDVSTRNNRTHSDEPGRLEYLGVWP